MRSRSIQFRLTVWYALVLSAALALFGGLLWLSLRNRLTGELDEEIAGNASRFEAYFRKESVDEGAAGLKVELEEFCQALPASSYLDLRGPGAGGFEFHYPAGARKGVKNAQELQRRFTVGQEVYTLRAGSSARSIHHTLDLLAILLFSLIPLVIGVACLGGAWLSRRALRPVDELTAAARAISIDNLGERLPVPRTGDELERLTEVWNTMLGRIDTAVQTLSQFAADASHELRTPLAVIRTSAELALRRTREPEEYRASLAEVVAEAERMTQLVEDLLFLARADAGGGAQVSPLAAIDLRDAVGDAVAEVRDLAVERDIRVGLMLPETGPIVQANRAALRRLFLVLLDNALKYSATGSRVEVRVQANTVAVEDTGIGISAEDLPHIFQRFYRSDKARSIPEKQTSGGHGLGLALAQTIAQVHGASIEVQSVEGTGSVFLVRFPVPAAHIAA